MIVWTFSDIVICTVFCTLICIGLCFIAYTIVVNVIHKLFYKNCRNCKHCKLANVAGCGDGADYSCEVSDKPYERINKGRMVKSGEAIWRRCNKFEK